MFTYGKQKNPLNLIKNKLQGISRVNLKYVTY